jgi:superfamily I DNA and/or RNA helicase
MGTAARNIILVGDQMQLPMIAEHARGYLTTVAERQ